jgi:hypothetical protein
MATIFISPSGNDTTGAGTSGNPYLTLAKASAVKSSGDTISMAAGTYAWNDSAAPWIVNTLTGPALATGSNLPTAIIDGGGGNVGWNGHSG